jgi:putative transport protein
LTILALRYILRINTKTEEAEAGNGADAHKNTGTVRTSVEIQNSAIEGKTIEEIHKLLLRDFVISRICHKDSTPELVDASTTLYCGDKILVVASPEDAEAVEMLLGKRIEMNWHDLSKDMVSRRILITKPELNGMRLSALQIRSSCGVTITRINRAGIDLVAAGNLELQLGDRVTVVGPELSVAQAEKRFGNSLKRLRHPNLIPIFIGVALGVILGSIPFHLPGIPQPVKLGLAGGPLIIAILIGRYGPHYKLVTYTTMSANLMIREIGISLFLACVGLEAGKGFVDTIVNNGGMWWILYGAIITIVPLLIAGVVGRFGLKIPYITLIGVMSGSCTNPPALAFANEQDKNSDKAAVGYATVYPLAMFLRILTAQMMILLFC